MTPAELICLQCGTVAARPDATLCRRCGLRFGEPPRLDARLPSCPVCYREVDDDGRVPSLDGGIRRLSLPEHVAEHERHPVGDDDYLESLRRGDRVVIGRWEAPFDVVRRYLVTGVVEAGRGRTFQHNAVVTAMTQLRRWGPGAAILGDQDEWRAARAAVEALMERYHRGASAAAGALARR